MYIIFDDKEEEQDNIITKYESCYYNRWVKLIPEEFMIKFVNYNNKKYFKYLCDIIEDTEINDKNKKKKRNTLIQLSTKIENDEGEWLYLITLNDCIIKIGGTRNSITERFGSYPCGHHIEERGKSGKASQTNMYIYNTLYFYISNGYKVKLYGYKLPVERITRNILNNEVIVEVQTYHTYESIFITNYKDTYGFNPFLSDNCDPNYKGSSA